MTKIQEWEKMIERVENDSVSKIEILQFLKVHKPKAAERVKILPCVCGSKDIAVWWNMKTSCWFYRCRKCDLQSEEAKTVIQAKRNWNEMVKKEIENEAYSERTN